MALPPPPQAAKGRLMKDLKYLMDSTNELQSLGISIQLKERMNNFNAEITGPPDSPYEKAKFMVSVEVSTMYPFRPPKIRMLTTIWHPNIGSRDGVICVDILNDKWTPSLNLKVALLTLQNLLANPDPTSPQDIAAGRQARCNHLEYVRTAKVWSKEYGIGNEAEGDEELNEKLAKLVDLGVWEGEALRFLSEHNWDVQAACEHFFQ